MPADGRIEDIAGVCDVIDEFCQQYLALQRYNTRLTRHPAEEKQKKEREHLLKDGDHRCEHRDLLSRLQTSAMYSVRVSSISYRQMLLLAL